MYAEDNAGRVMMNASITEVQKEVNTKLYRNWVNNILDWTSNQMNTNVNLLLQGPMAAYLRSNTTAFKCPADNYLSAAQRAQGWTARTRSYSMNAFWGPYNSNPNDPNWPRGRNYWLPQYRQWIKLTQPSNPANSWLLIEEHPDSINEGYFINNVQATSWSDIPASIHNGAVNVTFADGHIETHLWRGVSSRVPVKYSFGPTINFDALSRVDYRWLMDRTVVPYP
ncbi:MAG: hypothetical protein IT579_16780 [Verrucomicrobia subdivision 3 bacterium]|nr:hypothetical protein [Limisphaerales bacterium]